MSAIVDQIVWLRQQGNEVILVSSGAVAAGRAELHVDHHLDNVEQRQLFSAIGQVKLIGLYYDLFREYKIKVGQVLTMKENFGAEEQYKNQEACMQVMLENDVLPIINENDTVCITELMFTDNDELSGLIAKMMKADTLILLSNVDGVYNGDPKDSRTRIIPSVYYDRDISEYISTDKSSMGRGGMESKVKTAHEVANAGIKVIIAGAGMAAALPGVIAASTPLPVIGVPIKGGILDGLDAVFSILQMPPGIPVATVSVNGAQNAAILAAQMIALGDEEIAKKIDAWKAGLGSKIEKANKDLDAISDYKFKC